MAGVLAFSVAVPAEQQVMAQVMPSVDQHMGDYVKALGGYDVNGAVKGNSGAIFTRYDCTSPQDANQYNHGQEVFVAGKGFSVDEQLALTDRGLPGGASSNPNEIVAQKSVTTDGQGDFCTDLHKIGPDEWGEYQVSTNLEGKSKADNYRVKKEKPTAVPPTRTEVEASVTSSPTALVDTVTLVPTVKKTPTPAITVSRSSTAPNEENSPTPPQDTLTPTVKNTLTPTSVGTGSPTSAFTPHPGVSPSPSATDTGTPAPETGEGGKGGGSAATKEPGSSSSAAQPVQADRVASLRNDEFDEVVKGESDPDGNNS